MAAEYGPPPAVAYPELGRYDDAELMAHGPRLVAELRAAEREGRSPDLPTPRAHRGLTRRALARAV